MMGLARLSAVTHRVAVGTSILLLPLYESAIVAKQIADLDRESGGRIVLGVGVGGEYPGEFRACHVPREERGRRADEAIPFLRELWTAEPISHGGLFYPMDDVRIHPAPAQAGGPPVVVAGRKEAAMRRAARLGDGWMPYLYSPRRYADSVNVVSRYAEEAQRDLEQFGWFSFMFVSVERDGDVARQQLAETMAGGYNQDFRALVDRVAVAGTSAEVIARLRAFADAGARHFIFVPSPGKGGDSDSITRRLTDEIIPALREDWV
jgi:alkanesulfonate monooxygenase SsuD/methylene tetrahydromethanopterin reductase-like flavin-dependent oxidoreductase (luciferase family)